VTGGSNKNDSNARGKAPKRKVHAAREVTSKGEPRRVNLFIENLWFCLNLTAVKSVLSTLQGIS
jgi:hypothetical protein